MVLNSVSDFILKGILVLLILLLSLIIYYLVNIGNKHVEDRKKINLNKRIILFSLVGIILIYFLYALFQKYEFLSDMIFTIIMSLIISYALNPIINYLETKNINRLNGVLIVYLSIVGIITILAFSVIPRSGEEIRRLSTDLPKYFDQLSKIVDSIYTKYYSTLGGLPPVFQGIETVIMDNIVKLENAISNGLENFVTGIIDIATKVVSIVLTPILTLYFLADKNYFKEKIINLIPGDYRDDMVYLASIINISLTKFIRGRLLMSLYVGISVTLLLLIMGIEFAVVIGFITGLFDIIPYIGPFIGFVPAVLFAFISKPIKAVWVSIIFLLIQWTENNILAPKIIGENMGMHPMVILLSIIVGGGIFGVLGMIISIPVVSITRTIFIFVLDKRKEKLRRHQ
ncbi:MAG TPA: AI-2E family transporter [Tissierellaceae bacterium]|nr:AI-2E family transporter [Tissierellaceae bacterium]